MAPALSKMLRISVTELPSFADLLAGVCVANPARLTFFKAGAGAGVGAFGSAATVAALVVAFVFFIGFSVLLFLVLGATLREFAAVATHSALWEDL